MDILNLTFKSGEKAKASEMNQVVAKINEAATKMVEKSQLGTAAYRKAVATINDSVQGTDMPSVAAMKSYIEALNLIYKTGSFSDTGLVENASDGLRIVKFDTTPTANSVKPVYSFGIKNALDKKFGYALSANGNLYFFKDEEDASEYQRTADESLVKAKIDISTFAEYGKLDFRFIVQPSGNIFINGDAEYKVDLFLRSIKNYDPPQVFDSVFNLSMVVTVNGTQTEKSLGVYPANKSISVAINNYVTDGCTVYFKATNASGNQAVTATYNVTKANLQISSVNDSWWAKSYVKGDTTYGIPLTLNFNVPCKLMVELKKNNTTYSSREILSSELQSNYRLTFDHPTNNSGGSGIYHISIKLVPTESSLSGLQSNVIEADIVCVSTTDTNNYIVINNRSTELKNYTNNHVFDYAVHVGYGNTTVGFVAKVGGVAFNSQTGLVAENEVKKSYNLNMELTRPDSSDFTTVVETSLGGSLVSTDSFLSTNRLGYEATSGANLLIKMAGRSNGEPNPQKQINQMNGAEVSVTYTDVNFTGNDGYQTIGSETSLRIAAGGRMNISVHPLTMRQTEGRTFEIDYKVSNILNNDTEVIKIYDGSGSSFVGLKATPTQIALQTTNHKAYDDQSCNYDGEDRTHLTIVVCPDYMPTDGNAAFDACFIYINGVKNRTFQYSRDINVLSNLIIGSNEADIDIYSIRAYNTALTPKEVEDNTCNWKPTLDEKQSFKTKNNIRVSGKVDVDLVKSLCNVMVVETENDSYPTLGWGTNDTVKAKLSAFFVYHPSWNWVMDGIDIQGQGTTSMGYFRWNIKGNTDSSGVTTTYANGSTTTGAALNFDGGTHPSIKKFCAKINFASSMQSHKIGSVLSYTDLAKKCEAIESDASRVSIFQYPFVVFQKLSNGTYKFLGLHTIGSDKGDKPTFGFNSNSVALEASDNDRLGSNFQVPWNNNTVSVDSSGETYTICGQKAWEDSIKNTSGVTSKWVPAYNFVYRCSQMIKPFNGTLAQLQNVTENDYQYWLTSTWQLYYYNPSTRLFEDSGQNVFQHLKELGYVDDSVKQLSADAQNEKYKEGRRNLFKAQVSNYFDTTNALFHMAWTEFHAATDNQTKNTYPYMINVNGSVKWRWRQDDMDTIFDIENRGKAYKQYCVEWDDDYNMYGRPTQDVWNGRYNQFWVLMKLTFANEYKEFMRTKFIPALHYGTGGFLQTVMEHFNEYYFNNAQNYFGAALYNEAASYCYELAHTTTQEYGNRGIALSQSLGDHYSAEKLWVRMRYIYMCSKYMTDLYGVTDSDAFSTRVAAATAGNGNYYSITPAIYQYPVYQSGQQTYQGFRIFPGEQRKTYTTDEIATTGDQVVRINGMSYIRSIGSLYKNTLKENITVNGKMLTELNLGTRTDVANIRNKVESLTINSAQALQEVEMSNLTTLAGVVDFSGCAAIKKMYADGTSVAQIKLCDGGNINTLHLPSTITTIELRGKKKLADLTIAGTDNITTIECSDCNDYATGKLLDVLTELYA